MAVTLTINGQRVAAAEGSTVLEAAHGAGIRIPTLCHHPDLSNVGACRLCVVSVERARGLQTACTTPALEGMVVNTESEDARATRKFVLHTLLTDHPNDCMRCEVNGACELQDLVYEYDVPWPDHNGARHAYPIDPDPNPFIFIDLNKCILCTRCVRACAEIQNRDVWAMSSRGFKSKLVAGADQNLLDAQCESCGQCVSYCPVGALYDKMSVGKGRANQVTRVRTTCSYCGVGCNYDLNVRNGKIIRVTSASDAPVNGRALCVKGRYGYDYVHHPDRLTRPLVRAKWLEPAQVAEKLASGEWSLKILATPEPKKRGKQKPHPSTAPGKLLPGSAQDAGAAAMGAQLPGSAQDAGAAAMGAQLLGSAQDARVQQAEFIAVDWDTALDVVTRKWAQVKAESGGDAFAVLTSAKCTNEENFLVNKLTRQVLGSNSIDHCARL